MMDSLREIKGDDIASTLPQPQEVGDSLQRNFDLWVGALGFEDRCCKVPKALADGGSTCKLALISSYSTNSDQNRAREGELLKNLDRFSEKRDWIEADSQSLSNQLRTRLQQLRSAADRPLRIGWDISVSSNRLILNLGQALLEGDSELEVLYSEAATYFPTEDEYDADPGRWNEGERMGLDRGTLNVRTSKAFHGEHSSQLANRLVIIPGYNRDRVRKVISNVDSQFLVEMEAAPISWLVGSPHMEADAWRERAVTEIHDIPSKHESQPVSTFDYIETLRVLEGIHERWGLNCNITLAPMGSKMQALGCVLFCVARPDIRVVFAQPEEYNAARYTAGVRKSWSVHLGRVDDLVNRLMSIGTLVRPARASLSP
jgi:hypothetical protein